MRCGSKFSGMLPLCSGVFSFPPPGAKSKLITARSLSKLCSCLSLEKYNRPQAPAPQSPPQVNSKGDGLLECFWYFMHSVDMFFRNSLLLFLLNYLSSSSPGLPSKPRRENLDTFLLNYFNSTCENWDFSYNGEGFQTQSLCFCFKFLCVYLSPCCFFKFHCSWFSSVPQISWKFTWLSAWGCNSEKGYYCIYCK